MSNRNINEILSSGAATIAVIKVSGIAVRGLEELSKPVKPKKYI